MQDFRNTLGCRQYISSRTVKGWGESYETFVEFLKHEAVPHGEVILVRDDHKQQWLFVPKDYYKNLRFVDCPHCGQSIPEDQYCNCPTVRGDGW